MRKPILVGIILTVVAVLVILALVMLARIGASGSIAEKHTFQVSNPDYLLNPSGYLVDYDNKVSSIAPTKQGLWVENIVNDERITVSYTVEKAGAKILDFQEIDITGIGYPAGKLAPDSYGNWRDTTQGKCWIDGRIAYLRQNLLHKTVYLVDAEIDPDFTNGGSRFRQYRILVENHTYGPTDNTASDVAEMIIAAGYGSAGILGYPVAYPFDGRKNLQDLEEVASLKKPGLWDTCKGT